MAVDLACASESVDQYPTLTGAAHGVGARHCPALGSQMEGSTFVICTPFTSKKQRRALKAWETKRAKAAMEEAAAEVAVTRQAAAETQRQELQARGTCAPSGAPHSCTCSDFVLSAADAIACHPCGNCGGLAPPASVAEAAAWTRAALSCGVDAAPPERRSRRKQMYCNP